MLSFNKDRRLKGFVGLLILVMSGCATDIGSKSYSEESVGSIANTQAAVVLKVRTVKVGGDKNQTGMIAGGAAGGLIGSQISSGLTGAIATVGLAGIGALGGSMAEKSLSTQEGLEITLRLADGALKTLVQGKDVLFKKGEHVLLLVYSGGRSKVVKEEDDAPEAQTNTKT